MNTSTETIMYYIIAAGILSIVYGFITGRNILNSSSGNAKMLEIASAIQEGARAYLNRQYKTIAIVGVVVLMVITLLFSPLVGLGYLIGATLSGLAGSYLVVAGTGTYLEGQTGGRGFIGLASMLFGNYKPFGILMGSGLFGFADALQLRSPEAVHGLLIVISIFLFVLTLKNFYEKKYRVSIITLILSGGFLIWFLNSTSIPNQFVYFTPHITTLIVLSFANQRIKLPEKIGVPYKKGELN